MHEVLPDAYSRILDELRELADGGALTRAVFEAKVAEVELLLEGSPHLEEALEGVLLYAQDDSWIGGDAPEP